MSKQSTDTPWRAVFDALSEMVLVVGLDHRILRCNAQVRATSQADGDPVGRTCHEVLHGTDRPIDGCPLARVRATREHDTTFIEQAGRRLRVTTEPIIDGRGENTAVLLIIGDVTGQPGDEPALHGSEREKSLLIDATTELFAFYEDGLKIKSANRAAAASAGCRPEELIGQLCYRVWAGRDEPCEDCPVERARRSGRPERLEKMTPDGCWWNIRAYPVQNENGETIGIAELSLDITERKRAERALRESEMRLRMIASTIACVFWMIDWSSHATVFASQAYERIWGRPLDELYRNSTAWADAIHPDDRHQIWRKFVTMEECGLFDEQYRIVHRDGSIRWIHDRGYPVRDGDGRITHAVGIAEDITEQRWAEQALLQSEQTARALLDTPLDSATLLDLDGIVIDANATLAARLGKPLAEIIGTPIWDHFPPDVAELRKRHLEQVVRARQPIRFDDIRAGVHLDNVLTPILDADGLVTRVAVLSRDVTASRAAELQVHKSREELRRLTVGLQREIEKVRSEIAREIHDDLGQQLTALRMDLRWIHEHVAGEAAAVRERADAASALLDNLTSAVRRIAAELRPTMLDHLGLWAAIEWLAEDFEQRFELECALDLDAEETGLEPEQTIALFRTVQEALTNVARHANASRVTIRSHLEGELLVLEVRDNGQGFDPDDLSSPDRSLGLLGMRERLHHLGGKVDIRSRPGQGTRVFIGIPLNGNSPAEEGGG